MVKKWCSQTMNDSTQIAMVATDHRAVAEQRLAGEGRDHLGEHAEGRQDQDVDLRMAPAQMRLMYIIGLPPSVDW